MGAPRADSCQYNADQLDFFDRAKRLRKVRENLKIERDMVVTKEAAEAIARYVGRERRADTEAWNNARVRFLSVPFEARNATTR